MQQTYQTNQAITSVNPQAFHGQQNKTQIDQATVKKQIKKKLYLKLRF
jgi:hypothetical protein